MYDNIIYTLYNHFKEMIYTWILYMLCIYKINVYGVK